MTDHAVRPESTLSLAFQIEQQIHAIGDQARIAVDQMFQQLAEAGWYWRSRYDEDTMPVHVDIGERLEYQAGLVIGEQLSNAILAYWVHLRRGSQVEWGTEESLGTLFSGLAGIGGGIRRIDRVPRGVRADHGRCRAVLASTGCSCSSA